MIKMFLNVSIPDYVETVTAGKPIRGTTPIQVSQQLHAHADKALEILENITGSGMKS